MTAYKYAMKKSYQKRIQGLSLGLFLGFGVPAIFWLYFGWRAAFTSFIIIQIVITMAKIMYGDE